MPDDESLNHQGWASTKLLQLILFELAIQCCDPDIELASRGLALARTAPKRLSNGGALNLGHGGFGRQHHMLTDSGEWIDVHGFQLSQVRR